jgi:hypothetical protein
LNIDDLEDEFDDGERAVLDPITTGRGPVTVIEDGEVDDAYILD